jgi:serine/tyrosine/threonine adenylyltransferase
MRLPQMAAHFSTDNASNSNGTSWPGSSLADLPKSWTFTSLLPPDEKYPTAAASHKTPRDEFKPRMVKDALFTWIRPEPAKDPELLCVSPAALRDLGIKEGEENTEDFKMTVAGNKLLGWNEEKEEGGYPWAQCYGGWQFGSWAGQLGDGRAISLCEITNPTTKTRYELQLKGAGITPYSRFADGKAVLRSSIREFIVSEALNALRIPTTRALSLTLLPHSKVRRETIEPGAIVARFAQTWLRIGTFDILRARGDRDLIRKLSTYIAENVFGGWTSLPARNPADDGKSTEPVGTGIEKDTIEGPAGLEENRFTRLYREIVRRNAKTVAAWQAYAFTNGVLNTDNTSIYGLSIDFGPFAFLDNFDPNYTPNHDDHMLRYSYRNQPTIIWWNLVRLGESLGELMGIGPRVDDEEFVQKGIRQEDAEQLVSRAEGLITRVGEEYKSVFLEEYKRLMTARLGLKTFKESDFESLYSELLDTMEALELDFNQCFRKLSNLKLSDLETDEERKETAGVFFHREGVTGLGNSEKEARKRLGEWLSRWRNRVYEDWGPDGRDEERALEMKKVNPKFIAKGWILDEVIRRVDHDGEREILDRVLDMALRPFEDSWGWDEKEEERFCGDVPRNDRAMQCSCSS